MTDMLEEHTRYERSMDRCGLKGISIYMDIKIELSFRTLGVEPRRASSSSKKVNSPIEAYFC